MDTNDEADLINAFVDPYENRSCGLAMTRSFTELLFFRSWATKSYSVLNDARCAKLVRVAKAGAKYPASETAELYSSW